MSYLIKLIKVDHYGQVWEMDNEELTNLKDWQRLKELAKKGFKQRRLFD